MCRKQAARAMAAVRDSVVTQTVEAVTAEIGRIVAERQVLREDGAAQEALEENRRRLVEAQARLSRLLIERYAAQ
jgi:hypothetical protein